jgi:hypothetical protein
MNSLRLTLSHVIFRIADVHIELIRDWLPLDKDPSELLLFFLEAHAIMERFLAC